MLKVKYETVNTINSKTLSDPRRTKSIAIFKESKYLLAELVFLAISLNKTKNLNTCKS